VLTLNGEQVFCYKGASHLEVPTLRQLRQEDAMRFSPRVAMPGAVAILSALLGFALVCVTPVKSEAAPILDQSQLLFDPSNSITCSGGGAPLVICGQSFTAGLTGSLTSVSFYLAGATGTPEAGLYSSISSAGATLVQTSATPVLVTTPGFYSFAFNFPVSVGDTLFFGFSLDVAGDRIGSSFASTNPYAAGTLFAFVAPDDFTPLAELDAPFQTFVDTSIPEPATLSLLGLGLAMGVRRWRQRKAR
jgi:hypothetical protein